MSHDSDDKTFPYQKDDAELRRRLTPMQYEVTQHAATERAFTGEYTDTEDAGIYKCVVCSTPLFESGSKFHSGCGWPSYFKPLNGEVIDEKVDYSHGMVRVEVRCNHCGAHLGHVFEDGPRDKTGLRYCINSAALNFESRPENE
ncbi:MULTISPECIES: peptide-methionine (R)-S-oxide reductase MsrB [Burkholderia]|uniref:Peptide methionine sulfoxide reductase MsrB n=2 Tax=Burkholderia TaxID=32008 RepID=A0A106Z5U8_BURCE|nr:MULTISPECIES: peptide-methionine (R)-S-oxide reductase MsrB [Burkholderia]OUE40038.1 peptide-methionine (R)-S-oxide reductase [Burkholderia territorii]AIO23430.1 methionine-R-sulfoxide reductase [Burkholderia cepacia ATCC 25416]ALK18915.1 methionine sulfoxide reductase B [Burkholderia cepacia ATCC 25416]AOI82779.1 methionine sulfoxide reductase B [Burkholderia cepacia]ASE95611.1 peptide-methionine (R)-S-oxide reductase [Burkholderia cepacia]